jgi:hypothetical protein
MCLFGVHGGSSHGHHTALYLKDDDTDIFGYQLSGNFLFFFSVFGPNLIHLENAACWMQ